VESLLARGSEGAILVLSELAERQHEDLRRRNLPFVIIDAVNQPPPGTPSIGATNFAGGYAAAEHLAALGHRRIAAIGGHEQFQCTRARIAGYRAALESAGLPLDRQLVRYGDFQHDGGLRAAETLLALPDPPTAVFAGSDQQATGVYEAVRRAGRTIPGDVSVVGFDDLAEAACFWPPLTTVQQDFEEVGRQCVALLLDQIATGRSAAGTASLVPPRLVRRSSSGPLR
jgi:DNA-binding LacI/PurR family transcriptional regulator